MPDVVHGLRPGVAGWVHLSGWEVGDADADAGVVSEEWEHSFVCRDVTGREREGMILFRNGELVVAGPPPSMRFTADDAGIAAAEEVCRAFAVGVEDLRRERDLRSRGQRRKPRGR
ncbi:MAG: hypothetical protein ACRDTG_29060 [Pseudonocardiaceae bacterium]